MRRTGEPEVPTLTPILFNNSLNDCVKTTCKFPDSTYFSDAHLFSLKILYSSFSWPVVNLLKSKSSHCLRSICVKAQQLHSFQIHS
ncbi:unnamed protein product [Bubo scandiacus]